MVFSFVLPDFVVIVQSVSLRIGFLGFGPKLFDRVLIRIFWADQAVDECEQCQSVMEELENIDDDCDRHGIAFVKTQVGLIWDPRGLA